MPERFQAHVPRPCLYPLSSARRQSFQGYFSRALLGSITKAVNLARDAEAEPSTRFSQKNGKVNHNAVLDRLFEGLSSS
jgi:hypothetical protein